jgi:hypothetical protein
VWQTPQAWTLTTASPGPGPAGRAEKLGSLDVWARSAPIRLAGYEDDLAEPHILPSVD